MTRQNIFSFNFKESNKTNNFYTNATNINAYENLLFKNLNNVILIGPNKSGKSHLAYIWSMKFSSITYRNDLNDVLNYKNNVLIEDIHLNINEEKIFHIINHCNLYNLKLLLTSNCNLIDIKIKLSDLHSRLKVFHELKINKPNDDMLINILLKLLHEKQFIINSDEIFKYIVNRIDRSYESMINIVEKLDSLSLEKKRQLTIPLIKEIL